MSNPVLCSVLYGAKTDGKAWMCAATGVPWRRAMQIAAELEAQGYLVHVEPEGA